MKKNSALKQELHPALGEVARAQILVFKWETVYRRCLAELRICSSNSDAWRFVAAWSREELRRARAEQDQAIDALAAWLEASK
jgi:hypothetical protein